MRFSTLSIISNFVETGSSSFYESIAVFIAGDRLQSVKIFTKEKPIDDSDIYFDFSSNKYKFCKKGE